MSTLAFPFSAVEAESSLRPLSSLAVSCCCPGMLEPAAAARQGADSG